MVYLENSQIFFKLLVERKKELSVLVILERTISNRVRKIPALRHPTGIIAFERTSQEDELNPFLKEMPSLKGGWV